ncbi:hypothetical protein J2T09_005353 [Neorhizobium huautlense]|uniref:Uncharacterized protein n=1 Tax=Neorhizobium huautlense TaxID=67774 RepID=A0ABT9Q1G6_9HYPH|nr:hypothetical protein [Neorhizobium huautlense]MDP9840566.1 hypothetical protein [Neorhizobium huautlense]
MTKLLDRAIEVARELPAEMQDELARLMMTFFNGEQDFYVMSPEEEASFKKSLEQAARGEFASDERVEAIWSRFSR